MTCRRRSSRPRSGDDAGFGLPELIVSMALFAILGTLVLTLITTFSRTFTRERSAVDSTNVAAMGMNELTRVMRAGTEIRVSGGTVNNPVFLDARAESLIMHAFLDTDSTTPRPLKVSFSIDGNRQLVESRWLAVPSSDPFWTFGAVGRVPDSQRPVARQIPVFDPLVDEAPLFTYRTAEVCATSTPDCNVLVPPTGGTLSEADRRRIALVEIRLTVQADITARAEPVTIRNQVGLPNLGIDRVGASR